jgi:hypothetical protein
VALHIGAGKPQFAAECAIVLIIVATLVGGEFFALLSFDIVLEDRAEVVLEIRVTHSESSTTNST